MLCWTDLPQKALSFVLEWTRPADLKTMSLVCKQYSAPAQALLFSRLSIDYSNPKYLSARGPMTLNSVLERRKDLSGKVRTLHFSNLDTSDEAILDLCSRTLRLCSNAKHLELEPSESMPAAFFERTDFSDAFASILELRSLPAVKLTSLRLPN